MNQFYNKNVTKRISITNILYNEGQLYLKQFFIRP